jgi:hypothetical protein
MTSKDCVGATKEEHLCPPFSNRAARFAHHPFSVKAQIESDADYDRFWLACLCMRSSSIRSPMRPKLASSIARREKCRLANRYKCDQSLFIPSSLSRFRMLGPALSGVDFSALGALSKTDLQNTELRRASCLHLPLSSPPRHVSARLVQTSTPDRYALAALPKTRQPQGQWPRSQRLPSIPCHDQ